MVRPGTKAGFTLIELMIVVAIVGVLAVLGTVAYRKMILGSHTSEATHMVQAIRVAQEAYHAETQNYVSTSSDGISAAQLFPLKNSPPGAWKTPWVTPALAVPIAQCIPPSVAGDPSCFSLLPVHTNDPVMYGYATLAGNSTNAFPNIALPNTTLPPAGTPAPPATDWYWITASGNPSGKAGSLWSYVVANSFANDVFVQDEQ
jgi:prepilin-type N-terminal cleavage/methylation domain-containing protein